MGLPIAKNSFISHNLANGSEKHTHKRFAKLTPHVSLLFDFCPFLIAWRSQSEFKILSATFSSWRSAAKAIDFVQKIFRDDEIMWKCDPCATLPYDWALKSNRTVMATTASSFIVWIVFYFVPTITIQVRLVLWRCDERCTFRAPKKKQPKTGSFSFLFNARKKKVQAAATRIEMVK